MAAIKNFFKKRKADAKFKLAGPGHSLAESSTSRTTTSSSSYTPQPREAPSHSQMMSAVAAIERSEKSQQNQLSMANRSSKLIKAEALKALELEKNKNVVQQQPKQVNIEASSHFSVNGVFFRCPLIGPDVLPKDEMAAKIKEFLYEQLEEERGLTSVLIIHTCNKNKQLVEACIETLTKCLTNIIDNPTEEKYRKIRVKTKTFQEKILPVEGVLDFLMASGFVCQVLPNNDGVEEEFYVMSEENARNIDNLETLRDALSSAEPIRPDLDRNVRVLQPSAVLDRFELPPEFYNISAEELKREQQLRSEEVEQNMMLKTKAMRQREAERELRRYRFCLIRIKFPDGVILQGTFKTWETLADLKEFIKEHLKSDIPFRLITGAGQRLTEDDSKLAELGLVPAAIVNFSCDMDNNGGTGAILKPETLALLSDYNY